MALIQDSPKKKQHPKRSTSCFLGCFGFSITNNQEKLYYDKVKYAGSKRKQSSCFSFKRFQRKQSPLKKTVAVVDIKDGAEKLNTSREIHEVEKPYVKTATTVNKSKVSATCQTVHLNKFTKSKYDKQQDIILENRKKFSKLQHSSCQKGLSKSFSTTGNASNLIGSPQDKHEISRTVSLPPPKRNKQPVLLATNRDKVDEEKDMMIVQFHGNFDSIIGMSILMVTLIIMLFCGKFCAIVCTSVWFYFLPRFRAKNESVPIAENNVDLPCNLDVNSMEYKKKVVLHGLLERNHRNM